MSEIFISETKLNNVELKLETGRIAKQADGAVVVTLGQTVVLCTAVISEKEPEIQDFTDMSVYYQERFYAAGKIPGGFIKREGKPTDKETLISRIIDRSLRPVVKIRNDQSLQIICTVLAYDGENVPDVPALIGATTAIKLAGIDCHTLAGTRLCLLDGEFIVNPKFKEIEESTIELFVSGTANSITMVECGALENSKQQIVKALKKSKESLNSSIKAIDSLISQTDRKPNVIKNIKNRELSKLIKTIQNLELHNELVSAFSQRQKKIRYSQIKLIEKKISEKVGKDIEPKLLNEALNFAKNEIIRNKIILHRTRIDGRGFDDIREISCEVSVLPKVHGSALFTRGETQVLSVITIGTKQDIQMAEDVTSLKTEKFMLHYNFPSFSVGEIGMMKSISRRETGHGNLARKAILPVLPNMSKHQYAIRAVAEVLECNGSSSMAAVCASSMALMDAGIPIQKHVAGIAMGMIKSGNENIILSDIMGDEDHLGDMDFKLAGTLDGITAIQMDTKTDGIKYDVFDKILDQATIGINYIIARMHTAIVSPRNVVSEDAPKMMSMQINKDSIRTLIGPGGKTIKEISSSTKSRIDIDDDGKVTISYNSSADMELAIQKINSIVLPFKVGNIYDVNVIKVAEFGVFVKLMGGTEGFIHISDLSDEYIDNIEDHMKVIGQEFKAKMIGFDRGGKIKLSLKNGNETIKNEKIVEQLEKPTKVIHTSKESKKKRFF